MTRALLLVWVVFVVRVLGRVPAARFVRPTNDEVLSVGTHAFQMACEGDWGAAGIVRVKFHDGRDGDVSTIDLFPSNRLEFILTISAPGSYFADATVISMNNDKVLSNTSISFEGVPRHEDISASPPAVLSLQEFKDPHFFIDDVLLDLEALSLPDLRLQNASVSVLYISDLASIDGYKNHLLQQFTLLSQFGLYKHTVLDLSCKSFLGQPRVFRDLLIEHKIAREEKGRDGGTNVVLAEECLQIIGWPTLDAWIADLRRILPAATDFWDERSVPVNMRDILKDVFRRIQYADVLVLANGNMDKRDGYLVSLARLAGTPVVFDLGPNGPEHIWDDDASGISVLVAQSAYVRGHPNVRRFKNVVTLPPMIDASFGIECASSPRTVSHDGADVLTVLFVGRLVPLKGAGMFVRAAAHANRRDSTLRFAVIGDGPQRHDLQALAFRLGISLTWHGFITPATALACMLRDYSGGSAGNAILVYPSLYPETFGMVALEAMMAGIPVIAFGGVPGGPSDFFRHLRGEPTATLVTAPHTPARLGDAVVELAADKARRIKLSRVARQFVDTVYQQSRTARRYAALYEILRRQKKDCVTRECNVQ